MTSESEEREIRQQVDAAERELHERKRRSEPARDVDEDAPPSTLSNQNYEETHPEVGGGGTEESDDHVRRAGERIRET